MLSSTTQALGSRPLMLEAGRGRLHPSALHQDFKSKSDPVLWNKALEAEGSELVAGPSSSLKSLPDASTDCLQALVTEAEKSHPLPATHLSNHLDPKQNTDAFIKITKTPPDNCLPYPTRLTQSLRSAPLQHRDYRTTGAPDHQKRGRLRFDAASPRWCRRF